jgi:NTE family protein
MFQRPKIGLALGGGAARGFAHIGVLKVMEREGIPIDVISGTSIGAFVGAGYSFHGKAALLEERFKEFVRSKDFADSGFEFLKEDQKGEYGLFKHLETLFKKGIFLGYAVTRRSFISHSEYEKSIDHVLGDINIEELEIPFAAVALDITAGREVVITKGSLKEAVWASSAIPGFLPPKEMKDGILVDGGWIDKVPVLPAYLLGADIVIAVDISSELLDTKEFTKGYEIMIRARAVSDAILRGVHTSYADVVIRPNVGLLHWADFSQAENCISEGEIACREILPELKRLTKRILPLWKFSKRRKRKWIAGFLENQVQSGSILKI